MKTFGKYLVMTNIDGKAKQAHPGFKTRKDAVATLDMTFEKISDNLWKDSKGQEFWIEKNTKEYK